MTFKPFGLFTTAWLLELSHSLLPLHSRHTLTYSFAPCGSWTSHSQSFIHPSDHKPLHSLHGSHTSRTPLCSCTLHFFYSPSITKSLELLTTPALFQYSLPLYSISFRCDHILLRNISPMRYCSTRLSPLLHATLTRLPPDTHRIVILILLTLSCKLS